MIQLQFKIEGEKQVSRRLRINAERLKDYTQPMRETGTYMRDFSSTQVFSTQGSVIGNPWQALSPNYEKAKAKKYPGAQTLVASGKMKGSFFYESGTDYVIIGNSVDYFKYHQSNRPRFKLPRRVMLKIDNPRKENIVRIFNKYVKEALR